MPFGGSNLTLRCEEKRDILTSKPCAKSLMAEPRQEDASIGMMFMDPVSAKVARLRLTLALNNLRNWDNNCGFLVSFRDWGTKLHELSD
jgi:hypothetical protein